MESDLEQFAEHVRRECNRIMDAALAKNHQRAAELAAALCTQAATIVQQKQMERETSEPGRYDLNTLPSPSDSNEDE